ncbi:hypothetical protein GBA52_003363 [Prunus armeniaca]|nr:hypothetical protein GBA52_003363 [Prunus armeniaca]
MQKKNNGQIIFDHERQNEYKIEQKWNSELDRNQSEEDNNKQLEEQLELQPRQRRSELGRIKEMLNHSIGLCIFFGPLIYWPVKQKVGKVSLHFRLNFADSMPIELNT